MRTKQCTLCKVVKPINKFFHVAKNKDGYETRCKPCKYIMKKKYAAKYSQKYKVRLTEYRQVHYKTISGRYSQLKHSAKKRGIPFYLSFKAYQALWDNPCHYCGKPVETIGIDRVDNERGYYSNNVVRCCRHCNICKRGSTVEQFLKRKGL